MMDGVSTQDVLQLVHPNLRVNSITFFGETDNGTFLDRSVEHVTRFQGPEGC